MFFLLHTNQLDDRPSFIDFFSVRYHYILTDTISLLIITLVTLSLAYLLFHANALHDTRLYQLVRVQGF